MLTDLEDLFLSLLWKERLNSDGQQFHQYQQNKQSSLTLQNTVD
jgi:hypothetical protein